MNEPLLVNHPDKVDQLYWDNFCGLQPVQLFDQENG